ncbi:PREDICTED: olfactory receptor 6B2-like [Branchiostoma belcheri]|uniref:Olfactory receptor 6B2-like n=1 Tax=Branchiostoma belcheri TaxID=7741 RepID=A0A6P4ZHQ4_BRABE|nr:PREDICTED: olfactory receptor 6B2-like [Branchiostoma belcheri]
MEEETDGSSVEDCMSHVLSIGSTSRDLQTAYLIISLVLSVGCCLLLMFLVWKKEYLQKPSHYLRCNLAVDDIVFTGCLIPVQINALFRQDASGEQLWCSAEVLVGPACLLSMFGTYVMMAVDLYYFVCHPLHYHDKVTTKRVLLGILAFRTLSLVGGLGPVVFGGLPKYNLRCEIDAANSTSVSAILRSTNVLFAILVALSVFIIYCRVFLEAKRQQERDENRSLWVFQTKAFKVMVPHAIVLTASLTTTIFRIATLRAVISEEQMSQRALIVAARVALLLYLTLSSVANPVIYSFRLPEFRRACKELCGWPTNLNPPAVPARRHRQDEVEMATITGPRRRAPASELAPAQTSSEGTITQLTEEIMPSDQARKQTTQASPDQRLEQGTVTESASG